MWLGLRTKGAGQEKVSLYSKAEGFVVLFFTLVWVFFYVGCVLYIVDCYHYVRHICIHYVNTFELVCDNYGYMTDNTI